MCGASTCGVNWLKSIVGGELSVGVVKISVGGVKSSKMGVVVAVSICALERVSSGTDCVSGDGG